MECELVEGESNFDIVDILVDKEVLKDGRVDIDLLHVITFDLFTNVYYEVSHRVCNAFSDGLKLKN